MALIPRQAPCSDCPFPHGFEHDLISGSARAISRDEAGLREKVTKDFKKILGDCDCICEWHPTYGWVPEAGCPVHDTSLPELHPLREKGLKTNGEGE